MSESLLISVLGARSTWANHPRSSPPLLALFN